MATALFSNPLTAKPTDAIAPELKGFDPAQQAVLNAEQEQERYKTFQDLTKSEEQKMLTEGTAKATETYAKEAQPKELTDELKKKVENTSTPFIPTQQTAGDLGTIFAVTNILGFAIGRGAKGSAQAALSAQNGMLEGYQKGQMDVYKKQKDVFDENQKALSKAIEGLKYELTQAEKTASINKELAMSQVQQAISKHGADTLGKYIDQFGLPKGVEYVKSLERMDKENQDRIFKQKEYADKIAHEKEMERQGRERLSQEERKITSDTSQYIEDAAQAIAKFSQSPPGLRDKNRNKILARVREINPEYNEATYKDRDLAYRQYANPSGAGGKQIIAFNTVADHLNSIEELSKALENGDTQSVNRISNYLETQFGVPNVTNFNAAKQFVSGEVVKAITGTAGALKDREEAQRVLDAAQSPEQLQEAIDTTRKLIAGRTKALQREYEQGTGRTDFDHWLTPSLRTEKESSTVKTEATKTMPSTEKLQAYTNAHPEFGGDINKARKYLSEQGYK